MPAKRLEKAAFDRPGESRGWHTALYFFAEHVKALSHGRVNHKVLYSYVGVNGHYINHDNPTIRKRTAAMLSRLIHSHRYAADFKESHDKNPSVFDEAAAKLRAALCDEARWEDGRLIELFSTDIWRDVERGLENERSDGRLDLNLARISNEMRFLFAWCAECGLETRVRFTVLASSYFHLLTFGHLNEQFVAGLAEETPLVEPLGAEAGERAFDVREDCACLVKYADPCRSTVLDWWVLEARRPFFIGRYTDCDAIETCRGVSRLHGRIAWQDGAWLFEDMGSRNGSRVVRGDEAVFDSAQCAPVRSFALRHGDCIVLADSSFYWFGALCGDDFSSHR